MTAPPVPRLTVVPRAAQPEVPWRNGGGTTREVAAEPWGARAGDRFTWRISIAQVAVDGPFSTFPGVDRTLWLLRGAGMELDGVPRPHAPAGGSPEQDRTLRLDRPLSSVHFAGETAVHARLLGGPTEDLNVMVDRTRAVATTDLCRLADGATRERTVEPLTQHVLLVLGGALRSCAPGHDLAVRAGDALLLDDAPAACTWTVTAQADSVVLWAAFAPR